jgi:hypothetical protein
MRMGGTRHRTVRLNRLRDLRVDTVDQVAQLATNCLLPVRQTGHVLTDALVTFARHG